MRNRSEGLDHLGATYPDAIIFYGETLLLGIKG